MEYKILSAGMVRNKSSKVNGRGNGNGRRFTAATPLNGRDDLLNVPVPVPLAGGLPLHKIDWARVEALAAIHCTYAEIAMVLGLETVPQLTNRKQFEAVYKRGWERGKMSLRRKQFQVAMGGHPGMLIWLGKQILGQREVLQAELTGKDGGPIEMEQVNRVELSRLSLEELKQLEQLVARAGGNLLEATKNQDEVIDVEEVK